MTRSELPEPIDQKSPLADPAPGLSRRQRRWHEVIFEADTPAGKAFDVTLLVVILLSIVVVMLESVKPIQSRWGTQLNALEWVITALFTIEYAARLASVAKPWRYATSFFGVVDLLAILPTYLSLFVTGTHSLATIRTLRLIRVFRVFKMGELVVEFQTLMRVLRQMRSKITVLLSVLMCAIVVLGTVMYLIERDNPESGFTSIPISIYWAIVTITTVGYGDIAPISIGGQTVAALIMLLGYSVVIVTIGIFSAEVISSAGKTITTQACQNCSREGHDADAVYCKYCGGRL